MTEEDLIRELEEYEKFHQEPYTTGRVIDQPTFFETTAHYWVIIGLVILALLLLSAYLPHPTIHIGG